MRIISSLAVLFLLLRIGAASEPEYAWPTDASVYLTSSFAESRSDHFHAGLDIKTWAREGYRVFATRDGYIWKVRVSPFGYGKVIYQILDTGELAVYAHLQRFIPELENLVYREQQKKQRYTVTLSFRPGEFPVKKGQLIAFTGRTGIGSPHLHFEIRRNENTPVNPLTKNFPVRDSQPPTPVSLAVLPLEPGSHVDGQFLPRRYRLTRITQKVYTIPRPVQVAGFIGFAIRAYDQDDGRRNKFAVYKIQTRLDGSVLFESEYRQFSYFQTRKILLDRNYYLKGFLKETFYNLFVEPENDLPFYAENTPFSGAIYTSGFLSRLTAHPEWLRFFVFIQDPFDRLTSIEERYFEKSPSGYVSVSPGSHTLEVVLEDFFGNRTTVQVPLLAGEQFTHHPQLITDKATLYDILNRNTVHSVQEYHPRYGWLRTSAEKFLGQNGNSSEPQFPLWIELVTGGGQSAFPLFYIPGEDFLIPRHWNVTIEPVGRHVVISATADRPVLADVKFVLYNRRFGRQAFRPVWNSDQQLSVLIDSYDLANTRTVFRLETRNTEALWEKSSHFYLAPKDRLSEFRILEGAVRIRVPPKASNRDLLFAAERLSSQFFRRAARTGHLDSPIFRLEPDRFPLLKPLELFIKADTLAKPRQVAIYRWDPAKRKWNFSSNKWDGRSREFFTRIYSFGTFALLRDRKPPYVRFVTPRQGQTYSRRSFYVKVTYDDDLSGIGTENDFRLTIDGQFCIAELDPELKEIHYQPRKPLSPGKHTLSFWIQDRAGNRTEKSFTFMIR
jgi:hypothetical protein